MTGASRKSSDCPSRRGENCCLILKFEGEMSVTGLRQMGITAHVLILPGAAIDHNRLLCVLPLQLDQPWALDAFSVTAARIRAFNASSSIFSPSWKSMARLVFPSRLELKMPEGSFRAAPLAKVIFTTFLYVSPVQINPSCDHTGTPLHFHSSTTSGSASLTKVRSRLSILPRQSPSSLILASISREGDLLFCDPFFFMPVSPPEALMAVIATVGLNRARSRSCGAAPHCA